MAGMLANVRAVVFDLDGTLLNAEKRVSARTELAVTEFGYTLVFATARPIRSVRSLLPEGLQQAGSLVCLNGAQIQHGENTDLRTIDIEPALTQELIDHFQTDPGCSLLMEIGGELVCLSEIPLSSGASAPFLYPPTPVSRESTRERGASKMLVLSCSDPVLLNSAFGERTAIVCTDGGSLTQIMAKGVSKEEAVAALCKEKDISLENVLVFGDDYNDLGLFQVCGYPVAMGNAVQELKQLAREVTDTNDRDGVAIVLERLLEERALDAALAFE